jgi:purine-binding chemotaxis protein CheW
VIDLRMRVGLEPSEIGRQSRVVAVASRGRLLGLLVDAVHQVVHLDLNRVQPPPEDVMTVQSDYILGVYHQDDSMILLLDVDRALVLRDKAA